jgi:hypothetical protein
MHAIGGQYLSPSGISTLQRQRRFARSGFDQSADPGGRRDDRRGIATSFITSLSGPAGHVIPLTIWSRPKDQPAAKILSANAIPLISTETHSSSKDRDKWPPGNPTILQRRQSCSSRKVLRR